LKVSKKPFICDMLFFIGAVICILILIVKGYLSAFDSMIMLGYYIIYVVSVVVINWRKHIKKSRIENYQSLGLPFPRCEFDSDSEDLELYSDNDKYNDSLELSETSSMENFNNFDEEFNDNNNEITFLPNKNKREELDNESEKEDDENTPLLNNNDRYISTHVNINSYFENEGNSNINTNNATLLERNLRLFKEKMIHTLFPYFEDWDQQSLHTKCINLICMPFRLALTITIPVITPEIHKAYGIQMENIKGKSTSNTNKHHHHHHHHKPRNSNDTLNEEDEPLLNNKEKLKNQQLSRILTESQDTLSRSTSFEEIDNLVRQGLMNKQKQLFQNNLSKSFTNDDIYQLYDDMKSNTLDLNKKKYKSLSSRNLEDNLYQKALRNTSYLNNQKQKEKERDLNKNFNTTTTTNNSNNSDNNNNNYHSFTPSEFANFESFNSNLNNDLENNFNSLQTLNSELNNSVLPSDVNFFMNNTNQSLAKASSSSINNNNNNINNNNSNNNDNDYPLNPLSIDNRLSSSYTQKYNTPDNHKNGSYLIESNNNAFSMGPLENSMNKSFCDFNSNVSNSNTEISLPLLGQEQEQDLDIINSNQNNHKTIQKKQSTNTVNTTTTTTNDEITFPIEGPLNVTDVWNKWLIVIPTTICPLFITLVFSIDLDVDYYHWIFSCCLSVVAFLFTTSCLKNDQIPSYYFVFSIIGFLSGLCWIYVIANELVAVLQSLGKVLRISDSIMGLSFFAMGNSLGDLVTNTSIARMGFSKMALGACLGTPLLNIILGLGLSGMILTEKHHKPLPIKIDSNALYFSVIGLLICSIGTLFFVYFNNFNMTRTYGLCAIIIYTLIVIFQVIIEISYK